MQLHGDEDQIISPSSNVMIAQLICLFLPGIISVVSGAENQSLQEGVDLVTTLTNDLLPALLGTLSAQKENVVVGPFGVASNLAMVLEASSGKTRQEILQGLNITDNDLNGLRIGFKAYCDLFLEHSSHTEASGAFNSVSISSGFHIQPAFKNFLKKHYCANMTMNNAEGPSLKLESHAGVMSHWKDYEKLAVYTFLSHQPLRPFNKRNGYSVPVPMIPLVGYFKTAIWQNARAVLLPLENNMVEFLMITPEDPKQINALAKSLSYYSLMSLLTSLEGMELEVFIPQMTVVSKQQDLTSIVRGRGINLAFDQMKADLTRASLEKSQHTFLQKIEQDAYFSTSFVSLNSVSGVSSHLEQKKRLKRDTSKVYFNQPFLFLVIHRDTFLILLAGKVENPVQVPS